MSNSVWPLGPDPCLQDSSVHSILQARILEQVAVPSSRGSSRLKDGTCVSYVFSLAGGFFTTSTTWEAPGCSIGSDNTESSSLTELRTLRLKSKEAEVASLLSKRRRLTERELWSNGIMIYACVRENHLSPDKEVQGSHMPSTACSLHRVGNGSCSYQQWWKHLKTQKTSDSDLRRVLPSW